MNRRFRDAMRWGVLAGVCCLTACSGQQAAAQTPGDAQQGEVLTRGQLHEAFAEVVSFNPQPGVIVRNQQVPPPIQEQAPEAGPGGEGFIWIPGYWAWDDERNDFIWISGVWRRPPPGTQWVPGYWTDTEQGAQWISGYWLPVKDTQTDLRVQYLPTPPESRESGPVSPRPSEDDFWVPGYWAWQHGDYQWQAGFWNRAVVGWTWVPAHYAWTPRGCVFLGGYWDYTIADRGVPFSPVYFSRNVYRQPGFSYVPRVVLDTGLLESYLFCRPRYGHFYFGDYYNPYYESLGIVPWFAVYHSRFAYDPFYVYQRWHHTRRNPQWAEQVRDRYLYRVENESARPPRTFAALQELARQPGRRDIQDLRVAESLDRAIEQGEFPLPFKRLKAQERQQQADVAAKFQDLATERSNIERGRRGAVAGSTTQAQEADIPLGGVRQAIRQATGMRTPEETPRPEERPRERDSKAETPQQPAPPKTPKRDERQEPSEKQEDERPGQPEAAKQQPQERPEKETPPEDRRRPKEAQKPIKQPEPREQRMEQTPRRRMEERQRPQVIEPSERQQQRGRPSLGDPTPSRTTPSRTTRPESGRQELMPERSRQSPQRPETTRPGRSSGAPSRFDRPIDRPTVEAPQQRSRSERSQMRQQERTKMELPAEMRGRADQPRGKGQSRGSSREE